MFRSGDNTNNYAGRKAAYCAITRLHKDLGSNEKMTNEEHNWNKNEEHIEVPPWARCSRRAVKRRLSSLSDE